MNSADDWGALIDFYLGSLDRNAAWLARKIGRDSATISRWRSGESHPRRVADIIRVARAFGIHDEKERLRFFDIAARYCD